MPKYTLEPVDLNHPDLERSIRKGRCRVTAPNEYVARQIAHIAFDKAASWALEKELPLNPWRSRATVSVVAVVDDKSCVGSSYPVRVEVPRADNESASLSSWGSGSGATDLSTDAIWIEYPSDEYLDQAVQFMRGQGFQVDDNGDHSSALSKLVEGAGLLDGSIEDDSVLNVIEEEPVVGEVGEIAPFSKEQVEAKVTWRDRDQSVAARIRANPAHYKLLVSALVRLIDDYDDGRLHDRATNADPLWGDVEDAERLTALLREVRDELRRLNDLLSVESSDKQFEESARAARANIKAFLGAVANSTYGKVVQGGLGILTVAHLYSLGLSLGLPPLDQSVVSIVERLGPGK